MPKCTIAHGCSFTKYKWPCWPAYVSWFNGGLTMRNKGRSASGNETISRGAINSALKHNQIEHMYIMWSGTDRYEVITKEQGPDDRGEMTYRVWDKDFNESYYVKSEAVHLTIDKGGSSGDEILFPKSVYFEKI